jgi:cupin fold WbuC family metalloprotein
MKKNLIHSAIETLPGVYHALSWGKPLEQDLLEILIETARENINHKSRFCLHPSPSDLLQVTYLAFAKPYSDKIHNHPDKVEVVIPISGQAFYRTYDSAGKVVEKLKLDGAKPIALSTNPNVWHAIEVLSENFVMLEIGTGPLVPTSTLFQSNRDNSHE